jgi:cytosine/adenosine deaminase-related metal-dependent hydrolase
MNRNAGRPLKLIRAGMIADGEEVAAAPGAMLLRGDEIVAAGSPQAIGQPTEAEFLDLPDRVLIPALVNVHSHLDLSHIGPVAYPGEFVAWVEMVRSGRASDAGAVAAAVRHGAELARAGGTALVGDIAGGGNLAAVNALRETGLAGVSFLELFGLGRRQAQSLAFMREAVAASKTGDEDGVRLGLQPHAPYSCGLDVYRGAAETGLPLATHLAETPEEIEFVASATGPLADLLRRIGLWEPTIPQTFSGQHPVDHLAEILASTPVLAAHLNYIDDAHIAQLSRWPITVAYCPRASAYFHHPAGRPENHRYRDLLAAGVNVALGTDSLLCLDTPNRISVLDDMRLLCQRDAVAPRTLLRMATTAGARALGFDAALFTFRPGRVAGVLSLPIDSASRVDPLQQVLGRDDPPTWLLGPLKGSELS